MKGCLTVAERMKFLDRHRIEWSLPLAVVTVLLSGHASGEDKPSPAVEPDGYCSVGVEQYPRANETFAVSSLRGEFVALARADGPPFEIEDYERKRTSLELYARRKGAYTLMFDHIRFWGFPRRLNELHVSSNGTVVVGPLLNADGLLHTIEVFSPDGDLLFNIDSLSEDYSSYDSDCLDSKPWACMSIPFRIVGQELDFFVLNGDSVLIDLDSGEIERGVYPSIKCRDTPRKAVPKHKAQAD